MAFGREGAAVLVADIEAMRPGGEETVRLVEEADFDRIMGIDVKASGSR
ncbi:hypothetical protein [Pseudonocardia sp. NPDC046786]